MVVKKLEINGFRNLSGVSLAFGAEKNLIHGANGSGKTSVIEALFLLGFGKSFLPIGRRELVRFGADGFYLEADLLNNSGENRVSACQEKSFSLQLNGAKAPLAQVSRCLYPLFFSHFSYSQAIDYRPQFRRMIDRFVYGLDSLYLRDVLRYNTILKQKNYLLKNQGRSINNSELNSWNALIAETGSKIIEKRMAFTDKLNLAIAEGCAEALRVTYVPAFSGPLPASAAAMMEELEQAKGSELRCRRSLVGPQRDRFDVTIDGRRLPLFSSGERKKFLIMIYMAFIELFRRRRGEYPVFLIDDYDAAMDEGNLRFVLDHFPTMQVIATSVARNERFDRLFELRKEM